MDKPLLSLHRIREKNKPWTAFNIGNLEACPITFFSENFTNFWTDDINKHTIKLIIILPTE